jgi:hypothetical protein
MYEEKGFAQEKRRFCANQRKKQGLDLASM